MAPCSKEEHPAEADIAASSEELPPEAERAASGPELTPALWLLLCHFCFFMIKMHNSIIEAVSLFRFENKF